MTSKPCLRKWRNMNYCIYKLNFLAPLHSGDGDGSVALTNAAMTLHADTLFSAICNEAARTFSSDTAQKIIYLCSSESLLFSDTFPYSEDVLYIPKPIYPLEDGAVFDVKNRKAVKSVSWLPAKEESMLAYSEYIQSGSMPGADDFKKEFAHRKIYTKASVRNGTENAMPYRLGVYEFNDNCGLYGIIGYENDSDKELICKVFSAMSYSGIGGAVSGGCGRFAFELEDENNACAKYLLSKLGTSSENYMLLTTSLPKENELESTLDGGYYSIVRRGGFSFSPHASAMVKKKTQYFLGAGSVVRRKFEGDVYEVGENGTHTVYRYSKPIFMEVKL